MTDRSENIKRTLEECTEEELTAVLDYLRTRIPQHPLEREWGIGADIILSAISRSNDLTKRGVRGIVAEAVFEQKTLQTLEGWKIVGFTDDRPYDFLIRRDTDPNEEVRIQVKLQRMQRGEPMLASQAKTHYPKDLYVVEVQKTRGGVDPKTGADTRPYRFDEFDILAVNLHPVTRDWNRFVFTVGNWLIPRAVDPALIEIFQPVPSIPSDVWTDNFETCLQWLASGEAKRILNIAPDLLQRRSRPPKRTT